jgi:hypothetical protein
MKNGILLSFLSLGLIACNEEPEVETPSLDASLSAGIIGLKEQPILVSAEISEGDMASLNTTYTGNVTPDSSIHFSFTLTEDTQVAIVLSSVAQDLNLFVKGNDIEKNSNLDASNEVIVFDALADESYNVGVESSEGGGEFQLKLVEANRSSAGLSEDEYLVELKFNKNETCTVKSSQQYHPSDGMVNKIINWSEGYMSDSAGGDRQAFKIAHGTSFTVRTNNSDRGSDWNRSDEFTMTLNTNFATGAITGSSSANSDYIEFDYSKHCNSNTTYAGKIIL